ncbi:Protein transport protein DSL1 [Nakaseomyces bracarensis]|uniref:Protein transport protein DSL1 n=1 Tax=Nakaseomyces bracarensis TaxID=273131 RepID=A0ABR4NYF5_9SACH
MLGKEYVVQSLLNDPAFSKEFKSDNASLDEGSLLATDSQLSDELRDLIELKTVSSLIRESQVNYELLELENCYYSLLNLNKKLKVNHAFLKQSVHFQRSVAVFVDNLHAKLISSIYEIMDTAFWRVSDHSVEFKESIEYGPENISFQYEEFVSFIKKALYPDNSVNNSHWLIADIIHTDTQVDLRDKLNSIYSNYIEQNKAVQIIKATLFSSHHEFMWNNDLQHKLAVSKSDKTTIQSKLQSFKNLLCFLEKGISSIDRITILNKIGKIMETEYLRFVKTYATEILDENNKAVREQIIEVNTQLKEISDNTSCNWRYQPEEIERLLNDKQLFKNLLIDKIVEKAIYDLRGLLTEKDWDTKTNIEIDNIEYTKANDTNNNNNNNDTVGASAEDNNDQWEWNDEEEAEEPVSEAQLDEFPIKIDDDIEDGWGDEIDLELEDDENTVNKNESTHAKQEKEVLNEEDNDGWEDEWNIDEDLDDLNTTGNNIPRPEIGNRGSSDIVQITKLPTKFFEVIEKIRKDIEQIDSSLLGSEYFRYKFNVLQTFLFATSLPHYHHAWWQFYNDMRYIATKDKDLVRIQELVYNYMETNLQNSKKIANRTLLAQLEEFKRNERNPNWTETIDVLLPFLQDELKNLTSFINGEEGVKYIIRLFQFIFEEVIIQNILKWEIISEKNSEDIAELLGLLLSNTENERLKNVPRYKELYERVAVIARLLPLHLKDIMEMFYNGDFYLFTTEEIITWIKLLFADTPLRRDAIEDIYEIRRTALED